MAGSWKHGWIPLSPGAVASKNHGKKPGGGAKKSAPRTSDADLKAMVKTPEGRKEILRRQRERQNEQAILARGAAAAAGFTGPPKRKKPHRKSALKKRGR